MENKRTILAIRTRAAFLNIKYRYPGRKWTEKEKDLLKEKYNIYSLEELAKLLNRTSISINIMASHLGLKKFGKGGHWTNEEDNVVKKYYPIEGNICLKRLPFRTKSSLRSRAQKLNIFGPNHQKKIICLETGDIFINCVQAAITKNINHPQHISECASGKRNTVGGYHWRYADGK